MRSQQYERLAYFFLHLQKTYGVSVCIKDFSGFISSNKELDRHLQPYLAHINPFCMYIKSDKAKYRDCLSMITKMRLKSEKLKYTFFGMCHAGLCEYVTPIISHGTALGTINIGFFQFNERLTGAQIRRVCHSSGLLDEHTAKKLYEEHIRSASLPVEEILPAVEMAAEYLASTYDIPEAGKNGTLKKRSISSEDTILSDACAFLQNNFAQQIRLSDAAFVCHCSESYLSKIFQRRMKLNFNAYLNKLRIEASKELLTGNPMPISEIALSVGFNDSNYYSRIFALLCGIPPTEYRRRFYIKK